MQSPIKKELVLNALLMAVWRRKPANPVTVHSDQGGQYTSHDWQAFLRDNNLQVSMSRRGNYHDNTVAESFFQLLKRERTNQHIVTGFTSDSEEPVFEPAEKVGRYTKKISCSAKSYATGQNQPASRHSIPPYQPPPATHRVVVQGGSKLLPGSHETLPGAPCT